jgi:hypothetical protein
VSDIRQVFLAFPGRMGLSPAGNDVHLDNIGAIIPSRDLFGPFELFLSCINSTRLRPGPSDIESGLQAFVLMPSIIAQVFHEPDFIHVHPLNVVVNPLIGMRADLDQCSIV